MPLFGAIGLFAFGAALPAQAQVTLMKEGFATGTGSSSVVAEDDTVDWTIRVGNETGADLENIVISDTLVGSHQFVPGSWELPGGFSVNENTGTITADVMRDRILSVVVPLEKSIETRDYTLPTSDGDGWRVELHPTTERFFFTAHHWSTWRTQCYNLLDGSQCPNYPQSYLIDGRNAYTTNNNTHYEIFGDHYYFIARKRNAANNGWDEGYGIGCHNLVSDQACGYWELGTATGTGNDLNTPHAYPAIGFYKHTDTEWYIWDNRMRLHCFNPSTQTLCGSTDFSEVNAGNPKYYLPQTTIGHTGTSRNEIEADLHEGKLYTVVQYDTGNNSEAYNGTYAMCIDVDTQDACTGWTAPIQVRSDRPGHVFSNLIYDKDGDPTHVCASGNWNTYHGSCVSVSGSDTTKYDIRNLIGDAADIYNGNVIIPSEEYYSPEFNRSFFVSRALSTSVTPNTGSTHGVVCIDWKKELEDNNGNPTGQIGAGICKDWGTNDSGAVSNGSASDYAVTYDEGTGCMYSLGHVNRPYTFDIKTGTSPCVAQRVTLIETSAIEDNFCRSALTGFSGSWVDFGFKDVDLDIFDEFVIEFFGDSQQTNLLLTHDYIADGDTGLPDILNISSINAGLYQQIWYKIVADLKTGEENPFEDGIPAGVMSYSSNKAAEICFQSDPADGGCGFASQDIRNDISFSATGVAPISRQSNTLAVETAGLCPTPSIVGDRTFIDVDGDGVENGNDAALGGINLTIFNDANGDGQFTNGEWSDVTTSASNGTYQFTGIYPGDYCVVATDAGGSIPTSPPANPGDPICFTVTAGNDFLDADFGFQPFGSVGDYVFRDLNNDGIENGADGPFAGAVVELFNNTTNTSLGTQTTDSNGFYSFTDVPPGDYTATIQVPNGLVSSPAGAGVGQLARGSSYTFNVSGGGDVLDVDFGLTPNATIGDLIFNDLDADGVKDANEPGIAGVTVDLRDSNGDLYDSVTTNGDGLYEFVAVEAGTYTVIPVAPANMTLTTPGANSRSVPHQVTVAAGDTYEDADFGYVGWVTVGDMVYIDQNLNGINDPSEAGLAGVVLTLFENDNNDNTLNAGDNPRTTITAPDGTYEFGDVEPGQYCVQITVPMDYRLRPGQDSQNSPYCFAVTNGQPVDDADFGLQRELEDHPFVCDGSIYQIAQFQDGSGNYPTNPILYSLEAANGVYNYQEVSTAPFYGSINSLAFNVADGHIYAASDEDPANNTNIGEILRIGADGTWTNLGAPVDANDPTQVWTSGGSNIATADGMGNYYLLDTQNGDLLLYKLDLNAVAAGDPITFEILQTYPGQNKPYADFSFDPVTKKLYGVGSNSNVLHVIDLNDPNFARSTVNLTGPAISNTSGASWFNPLGELFVFSNEGNISKIDIDAETIEAFGPGAGPSGRNDGGSCAFRPGLTKDVDAPTHFPNEIVTYTFEVANPTDNPLNAVDFIDTLTYDATWIANSLEVDPACNGNFVGAAGVLGGTLSISNNDQTLRIDNMTLPAISKTCFSIQAQISIDAEAGDVENQATLSGIPAVYGSSVDSDYPPSIALNDPTPHEILPGVTVGDRVFEDQDGDGNFEAGDFGLDGITVTLLDSNNNIVDTTVTSNGGAYQFTEVRPGSYTVQVTVPDDYTLSDPAGADSQPSPYAITIVNMDILDADFGLYPVRPSIAVDKALIEAPVAAASGTLGNYDATYVFTILNTGNVDLDNLSLVDDLGAQFGNALAGISSAPEVGIPGEFTGAGAWATAPAWAAGADDGNQNYSGAMPNIELLTGGGSGVVLTDLLAEGQGFEMRVIVEIDPDAVTQASMIPLMNQATVTGSPTRGTNGPVTDDSDSGVDPRDDDEDDPFEDPMDPDDPTTTLIPRIELAKAMADPVGFAQNANNDGWVDLFLVFTVDNNGTTPLTNISIVDNLEQRMGANSVVTAGDGGETGITSPANCTGMGINALTLNAAWDATAANAEMVSQTTPNGNVLFPGGRCTYTATVTLDLAAIDTSLDNTNTATAFGWGDADGDGVPDSTDNDPFDPTNTGSTGAVGPHDTSDNSDSGFDPDSDNPDEPGNDTGPDGPDDDQAPENDDPTPISLPSIVVAKDTDQVYPTASSGAFGNVDVAYVFTVLNNGNVPLSDLHLYEHLAANFDGAFIGIVTEEHPTGTPFRVEVGPAGQWTGGSAWVSAAPDAFVNTVVSGNSDYTGRASLGVEDTDLLQGGTSAITDTTVLEPGEGFEVRLVVEIDPDRTTSRIFYPLKNQGRVEGTDEGGVTVDDLSDNGIDPTSPNDDENEGETPGSTEDPTPVFLAEVALSKDFVGFAENATNSAWVDTTIEFAVANIGASDLYDLSIADDIDAQLGAGSVVPSGSAGSLTGTVVLDMSCDGDGVGGLTGSLTAATTFQGSGGNTELVDQTASNFLPIGEVCRFQVMVTLNPANISADPALNSARVDAYPDSDSDGLPDYDEAPGEALDENATNAQGNNPSNPVSDISDAGRRPETINAADDDHNSPNATDGPDPDTATNNDDPTSLQFGHIALAKAVHEVVDLNNSDNVQVTFAFVAINDGTLPIDQLVLEENLAGQFGGAFLDVLSTPRILPLGQLGTPTQFSGVTYGNPAWVGAGINGNAGFTGAGTGNNIDLLGLGGATVLAPFEGFVVELEVLIDPDGAAPNFYNPVLENQGTISGNDTVFGLPVSDVSEQGIDPTTDNPDPEDPDDTPDTPTPLPVPQITLNKTSSSFIDRGPAPGQEADSTVRTFMVEFAYEIINTGARELTRITLEDDFLAQNQTPVTIVQMVGTPQTMAFNHSVVGGSVADFDVSGTDFLVTDEEVPVGTATAGAGSLGIGESITLSVRAEFVIDLDVYDTLPAGTFITNQAEVHAYADSDGDGVEDYRDPSPLDDQVSAPNGNADPGPDASDLSDGDGDPSADPNNTGGDPEDNPTPVPVADLEVTKTVIGYNQRGTLTDVSFLITAENVGDVPLGQLQIEENLEEDFGAAFDASVEPATVFLASYTNENNVTTTGASAAAGIGLTANVVGFTGDPSGSINLINNNSAGWATSELPVGATVRFVVVVPLDTYTQPDFVGVNHVLGTAVDPNAPPGFPPVEDEGDTGVETEDGDDPGDDPTDDPTPVPGIAALKSIEGVAQNTADAQWLNVTYRLIAVNAGNTPLASVNLEEDLDDQFGAAFISAINGGVDVGASVTVLNTVPVAELPNTFAAFAAEGSLTPNNAFDGDGDITLLDANQVLGVGRYVAVEFTVTLDPQQAGTDAFGDLLPLQNIAEAVGFMDTDGDGTPDVVDTNGDGTPDGPVEVRDDASDDVTGDPNDPEDPEDPTVLKVPSIGVSKTIANLGVDTEAQTITQVFNVTVENFGELTLYDITVTDDQAALIALDPNAAGLAIQSTAEGDDIANTGFVVDDSTTGTCQGGGWLYRGSFNGDTDDRINQITGGAGPAASLNCLNPGDSITLAYTIVFDYSGVADLSDLSFGNKVVARGFHDADEDDVYDGPVLDESTTGTDPDGGDDGVGADDVDPLTEDNGDPTQPDDNVPDEDDPTRADLPVLELTKDLVSVVPAANPDYLSVTWKFDMVNEGNVPVYDLSLIDDLACNYGDAFIGADIPVVTLTGYSPGGLGSNGTNINPGYRGASTFAPCSNTPNVAQAGTAADMLNGQGVLMVGDSLQVLMTATLDPLHPDFANKNESLGIYKHRLETYDPNDPDTEITLTDTGDDAQDPDDGGNNPTPSAAVVITKELARIEASADGTVVPQALDATYVLRIFNPGSSALSNLSVTDEAEFGYGAGFLKARSNGIVTQPANPSFVVADLGFNGIAGPGAELLTQGGNGSASEPVASLLMGGDSFEIEIVVTFDPDLVLSDPFQTDPSGEITVVTNSATVRAELDGDGNPATGPEEVDHDANPATPDQRVTVTDISDDTNPADLDGDGNTTDANNNGIADDDDDYDQNGALRDDPVATPIPDLTVVKGQPGVATVFDGTTPAGVDCGADTDEGFCYEVIFSVSLTNSGSSNLTNIQLVDDLQQQFTDAGLPPAPTSAGDAFLGASLENLVFTNANLAGADLSDAPSLNPNFNGFSAGATPDILGGGAGDPNLFTNLATAAQQAGGGGLLEPGDSVSVDIKVYVDPFILNAFDPDGTDAMLVNEAFGYGYADSDRDGSPDVVDPNDGSEAPGDDPNPLADDPTVEDESDHDGDLDGRGDPTDDTPGDDDMDGDPTNDDDTPFAFPGIKIIKSLVDIRDLPDNQNYEYVYTVKVINTGTVPLDDVVVTDNLTSAFGAAFVQVLEKPSLVDGESSLNGGSAYEVDWLNQLYDGGDLASPPSPLYTDDLLIDTGLLLLAPGDFFTLTFSAEIDFDANYKQTVFSQNFDPLVHLNSFENTAVVSALPDEDGSVTPQTSGTRIIDRSDDDADKDGRADGDNDGNPNNDDDPTPAPGLLTEKSVVSSVVPSNANAIAQLSLTGSQNDSSLAAPQVPFTATQNIYVGRFRFDLQNTGAMSLYALDLNDTFAEHPGVVEVRQAAFVDGSMVASEIDPQCPVYDPLWNATALAGFNAFDLSAATTLFDATGNDLGICEQVTFEIDVEFEIDPDVEGGWTNSAITTFGVDLNDDGVPDVMLEDYSDGDGNPLVDSDPEGAGPGPDRGDDPTRVPLARFAMSKAFLSPANPAPGNPPYFDYTVQISVQNIGDVPLTGVKLTDDDFLNEWYDLAAANPGVLAPYDGATVVGPPIVVAQSDPSNASITASLNNDFGNPGFLGQTVKPAFVGNPVETSGPEVTILDGAQLAVNENFTLQFVVRFNPFAFELPLDTYLVNQAEGIAEEADPNNPGQPRFPGIYTYDQSDSGFDPASDNPDAPRLPDEPNTFDNPTPLPNPAPPELLITKQATPGTVEVGDIVTWSVTVENRGVVPAIDVDVIDVLPAGFAPMPQTYQVDNSQASTGTMPTLTLLGNGIYPIPDGFSNVTINGVTVVNEGPALQFNDVDLNPGDKVVLSFRTDATIGLDVGVYVNQAYVIDDKWMPEDQLVSSSVAEAPVEIRPSGVFDCATIIGQVFNDGNGNGYQDNGEEGIPASRITALVAGTALTITTDEHGRYHLPCAVVPNQDRGTNVILKLDPRTMPSGYRITTENPRVIRATRGKMSEANFGATIDRVVRVDLNRCAFIGGSTRLTENSRRGFSALIAKLKEGKSTLRISYRAHEEDPKLTEARSKAMTQLVERAWARVGTGYALDVEVETIRAIGETAPNCRGY